MFARTKLGLLLCVFCALQGCGTLRSGGAPEPSFDINSDLEQLAKVFEASTNITAYYATPTAGRIDARNRFVAGRLVQIDLRYLIFIRALTSDKQQLDSATDIANLALNLAGTLVGGVQAKTNLAAAAAGISGTKTIIDKDYYYEKSVNALVATMNATRKQVLIRILTGLASPTLEQYPFERALTDLNEYYLAGTLNGALAFIQSEAAQSEKASNEKIDEIPKLVVSTPVQIDDLSRLTASIGSADLKLVDANQALQKLGVDTADAPKTLDAAKQKLQERVRSAGRLRDNAARNAAIKALTDAFSAAGILK